MEDKLCPSIDPWAIPMQEEESRFSEAYRSLKAHMVSGHGLVGNL